MYINLLFAFLPWHIKRCSTPNLVAKFCCQAEKLWSKQEWLCVLYTVNHRYTLWKNQEKSLVLFCCVYIFRYDYFLQSVSSNFSKQYRKMLLKSPFLAYWEKVGLEKYRCLLFTRFTCEKSQQLTFPVLFLNCGNI